MKKIFFKSRLLLAMLALSATMFTACDDDNDNPEPDPGNLSIAEVVDRDTSFSILNAAIARAGLATALDAPGNITVFAPDNSAFRAAGITASVINGLPPADVAGILLYHAVGAAVPSGSVPASDSVRTLGGQLLFASKNANGVFVNGIGVKTADVSARNGIIHVINGVLMPPTKTIAQIAIDNPNFSILVAAVVRAGLADELSAAGKYTVFAPTNAAFNAAGFNSPADINAADSLTVANIVRQHVIATNVYASDLSNGATAPTIRTGTSLTVGTNPPGVKVTGSASPQSNVVTTTPGATFNITATNGVIHVVDRVIL
ncbi:fasciclin domain-containing protein [Flavihumibacter rivuli]|uniref:fasciclin domain-containing protein n=1 Tax=Flavihumibacter rivuli TaxID=2838156 RepID=UPI001BDF5B9D|nr:fasciclin domain-containing protein [Flavihumibacter rivuli]ULQ55324.1 fasciclin domain-containing protein [Flavihumibacter rivuli]